MAKKPITGQDDEGETGEIVRRNLERRRSRRFPCEGFAEAIIPPLDTLLRGKIFNVSLEGCFVSTRAYLHIKTNVKAIIRFSLRSRQYQIAGEVANVRPGMGVGFRFVFEDTRTKDNIRCLVEEQNAIESRDEAEQRLVRGMGKRLGVYVGVRSNR
jgi:hypothetical protein